MSKKNKFTQYLALFLLLIAFPGISYFYLKSGYDYRKEAMSELQDHGQIPNLTLVNHNGEEVSTEDLKGNTIIIGVFSKAELSNKKLQEHSIAIHHQFDKRPDVLFLNFLTDADQGDLASLAERFPIQDSEQWQFFLAPSEEVINLFGKTANIDFSNEARLSYVDTSLTVRNFYPLEEKAAVGRLAEHIAMTLPKLEEKDIIFEREQEK